MSGVYKNKKWGTFEVKYREDGRQRSKSFKTKPEAEAFRVDIDRLRASGRPIIRRQDVPTLETFALEWLASRVKLAPTTQVNYAEYLEVHILPQLGKLSLLDLRPRRLYEWQRRRLADGAGPATLGKAQGLLRQILDSAVLPNEYLEVNPVLALKRPEYVRREHRWLTAAEVEKLRGWYLDSDDLASATLVSVLGYVGIRPQDALALDWTDVGKRLTVIRKVSDGEIVPGSKTGEHYRRTVYLPAPVVDDLTAWRAKSSGVGLIFGRSDGNPWTKTDWDNWRSRYKPKGKDEETKRERGRCFKRAAEEAGLGTTLKPYDLRHTAATLYAAAGWTSVEIGHQLGHSPEMSQRTYQHLLDTKPGERRSVEDYIAEARGVAPTSGPVRRTFGVAGG